MTVQTTATTRPFCPAPKRARVKDATTIRDIVVKRDSCCLYGLYRGGCIAGLHAHHIIHKGAGGDDAKENLITLCPKHHDDAHAERITKEELRAILTDRFGYIYN